MQAGPTVSGYLPRLEANATARRIRLRRSKAAMATDEGGRRRGGQILVTLRDDEAYEINHRLARSSDSVQLSESHCSAWASGPSSSR